MFVELLDDDQCCTGCACWELQKSIQFASVIVLSSITISGLLLWAVKSVVIDLSYYGCCCFYQQLTVFGSHTIWTEIAENLYYTLTITTMEYKS